MTRHATTRRTPSQGLNLTASDLDRPAGLMANLQDALLTDGKPTKRAGHARYNATALRRSMLVGRRGSGNAFTKANVAAGTPQPALAIAYPALSHALLLWHSDFQPTKAGPLSWDGTFHVGDLSTTRSHYLFDQAFDACGAGTQWGSIRAALQVWIDSSGILNARLDRYTAGGAYATFTAAGATVLASRSVHHVGWTWDPLGTGRLKVFLDGVQELQTAAVAFAANQDVAGKAVVNGANTENDLRPAVVLLNRIHVRRTHSTEAFDLEAATPRARYGDYPDVLEHAPDGCGVMELRCWNALKDFTSGAYPRNRPLTAAEQADAALIGYWPMDDGGGSLARDRKAAARHFQLLPWVPAWRPDAAAFGGWALQMSDGACLRWRSPKFDAVNPLRRELANLWGGLGLSGGGGVVAGPASCPAYTVQVQFTTPHAFPVAGTQSYVTAAGVPYESQVLLSVTFGTPVGNPNSTNRLDEDHLAAGTQETEAVRLGIVQLGAAYVLEFQDQGGAPVQGATTILPATTYVVTITRAANGTRRIFINAAAAADATVAAMPNFYPMGDAVCVSLGRQWDQADRAARGVGTTMVGRANKHQDCHCRISAFRAWKRELPQAERQAYAARKLTASERSDSSLLINLEPDHCTLDAVPSRCAYPELFMLDQAFDSAHLGGDASVGATEWWDSWSNAVPPHWGAHASATAYDPVGQEAQFEAICEHRDAATGARQMLAAASGVLYLDPDFSGNLQPVVPERGTGLHDYLPFDALERQLRLTAAAGRAVACSTKGRTRAWTGKALAPLGVDLPLEAGLPEAVAMPRTAPGPAGGAVSAGWYCYKFVYRDEGFNAQAILGPTVPVQVLINTSIVLGSDQADTLAAFATEQDGRPIRRHLNPRVSSIDIYRTRAATTADLCEGGPWYYHSTIPNADACGVDTVADTAIVGALDDRFEAPAPARTAELFAGRLVLGGFANAPSTVLWSQPGAPETFDLEDRDPLEDGTAGALVVLKAFGDNAFAFKDQSLWQLVQDGETLRPVRISGSSGLAAPDSVVEFYSPALAQRTLAYWAPDGPYLLNGSNPTYIGQALKGSPQGIPFAQLAASGIARTWAVDVQALGQAWFFVQPVTAEAQLYGQEHREVYAYDYVNNAWLRHVGMRMSCGAQVTVPLSASPGGIPGMDPRPLLFGGGSRGHLSILSAGTRGGDPVGSGHATNAELDGPSSSASLLTAAFGTPFAGVHCRDLVAMLVRVATGAVEVRWVLSNTATQLVPEVPFTSGPASGDLVLLAPIDFLLLYQNDSLDEPDVDKHVSTLTAWIDGQAYFRVGRDHGQPSGPWIPNLLSDVDGRRRPVWLNLAGEVFKLELRNPFGDAPVQVRAHAWMHSSSKDGEHREA